MDLSELTRIESMNAPVEADSAIKTAMKAILVIVALSAVMSVALITATDPLAEVNSADTLGAVALLSTAPAP